MEKQNITPFFQYSEKETAYLSKKDKKLAQIIQQIGKIERTVTPDMFEALMESIISQQISTKAAETVTLRFKALLNNEINPEKIAQINHFDIQQCGMTLKKASYIKIIADAVLCGKLSLDKFSQMQDQEIIDQLVALPGIGVWTAEMLMIFSLQRPDILSYDDLIIRRAITHLYGLKELTKEQFNRYKKRYSPYPSVASLYLWRYGNSLK